MKGYNPNPIVNFQRVIMYNLTLWTFRDGYLQLYIVNFQSMIMYN